MAKFKAELPNDLIKMFQDLEEDSKKIFGEMTQAGAKAVYEGVKRNMKKSFKTTKSLDKGLTISRVQVTSDVDSIQTWIGFYGYDTSKASKRYPKGKPIPLIAMAREYGTSNGEAKKPFFRKSFKKDEIENEMRKVEEKYLTKES